MPSRPKGGTPRRRELLNRLWDLGRTMSTQTVFLHQAIAQSVGLNATDTKCVDLILRAAEGTVTAGWLAETTGLTTGAITHVLDRLEQRQVVERVRDPRDRRKVFVRVRLESLQPLLPKYEAIARAYMEVLEKFTTEELKLICIYLERTSAVSQSELAKMISANRSKA